MSSKLIVDTIEDSTGTYSLALGSGNSTFPGGIHIGGTGSSNLLDDYEEGTWTPSSLVNGFSQSLGYFDGAVYCKIGQLVFAQCVLNFGSNAYASSYSQIGGLPFSASGSGVCGRFAGGSISGGGDGSGIYIADATTSVYLYPSHNTASAGWTTSWTVSFTYLTGT